MYGKSAGFKRNDQIVYNSDCIIAFWDGKSKGTLNTVSTAINKGLPVMTVTLNKQSNKYTLNKQYSSKLSFFTKNKK